MAVKPTIPSGTRDFSPGEVYRRRYIFDTIRTVFEKFGYQPIETPTMENLSTLEGKYGEEGDRLLFRIINSGDPFQKVKAEHGKETISGFGFRVSDFSEKGLRYDLTVPFARYVVMHQNEITFPFKRYQIQPVFRADRPQKGRYREFYQCDADVVGSDSLICEIELIQIYDEVFRTLQIPYRIKLNNRKVLSGIAEKINAKGRLLDLSICLDKYDKGGINLVRDEMQKKGFTQEQAIALEDFVNEFIQEKLEKVKLEKLEKALVNTEHGSKGVKELHDFYKYLTIIAQQLGTSIPEVTIDISLARGLNYYTGAILEVLPLNSSLKSSIGGGGRYDDLTGLFGLKGISGVGISFGADRIYDVMEELKLFPESTVTGTKVLFCSFDDASLEYALPLVSQIRNEGISTELYPSPEKIKKQLKYANDRNIPFVVMIGENERNSGKLTFKNMKSGEQQQFSFKEIISKLK